MTQDFSIIVTTHRGVKELEPLFKSTDKNSELIITDDGYNDNTKDFLKSYTDSYKSIIYAPIGKQKFVYTKNCILGMNIAFMYAEEDWLIRADDNLEFKEDFFDKCREDLDYFQKMMGHSNFGIIGQKLWGQLNHQKWNDYFQQKGSRYIEVNQPEFTFSFGILPIEMVYNLNGYLGLYDLGWGCFDGKTLIKTNMGEIPISKIVNEKLPARILSYNVNTKEFEYKPIIKYFKGSTKDWYSINMPVYYKNLTTRITGEHPVLTRDGWQCIRNLQSGKDIAMRLLNLNNLQREVIIGSLLGDASLEKHRIHYKLREGHSLKQEDYLISKYKLLNLPFSIGYISYHDDRWYIDINEINVRTKVNYLLDEFSDFYDENRRKRVLQKYLDELGLLGLSIWMMDDGTFKDYSATLYTESFTKDEVKLISDYFLNKWGLKNSVLTRRNNQYYISFTSSAKKWMLNNLYIKIENNIKTFKCPFPIKPIESIASLHWIPIKNIKKMKVNSTRYRYNINVADNHNYIANGIIAHNCEEEDFLLRGMVSGYKYYFDREMMGYSEPHEPHRESFSFNKTLYELQRLEILSGKTRAYNDYDIRIEQNRMLAIKDDYRIE